jgi:hypothetical protein
MLKRGDQLGQRVLVHDAPQKANEITRRASLAA